MSTQACLSAVFYTILTIAADFYICMCLYVAAMVDDIRVTLNELDGRFSREKNVNIFQINYFTEVTFHSKILE